MCVAVPTDRNNISLTTYASVTNRVGSHYRHRRVARKLILQSHLARTHYSTALISRKDKSTANKIHHFLIVKQDKIRNYPNKCGIDDFRKSFGSFKKKPAHLSQKKSYNHNKAVNPPEIKKNEEAPSFTPALLLP